MTLYRRVGRIFHSPEYRVVLGYGLFGVVWILLSDELILKFVKDPILLTQIQTYKGWAFILLSSLFIWVLLQHEIKLRNIAWNRVADSEQRFRHALRNSPVLISHQDLELRYTWVYNPSPSFDESAVIGKTDEEVFKPGDAANLTRLKRNVLATGASLREALTLDILGSPLFFDLTLDPLTDSQGNRVGVSCTAVDITDRVRTEKDLVEVEKKLKDIVHHSTNLFYSHTIDHVLTYVSPQSNHFLGCEPAEAMKRWTEFITDHPANQWAFAWTQKAIETARPQPPYELQLKTKDGRILWVEVNEAPVVSSGKTVAVVGSLTDITDRKEKQRALVESESKYRDLVDHSSDAIMVNIGDRIVFVNRSCLTLFNAEHENQLLGKSLFELFHPDFHDLIRNLIRHLRELDAPVPTLAEKIVCLDGRIRDVEVTASNFMLSGANAIHVILRDITEHKINQAVLQRLSIAVEGSGDIIFMTDARGLITYINNAFVQIYGYGREEIVGKLTPRILKSGKTDSSTYEQLWTSIASGEKISMRIVNRAKSGKLLEIETSVNPIVEADGQITGYLAVQRDVTEKVELHNKLIEKEALLRETEQLASIGGFSYDVIDGAFTCSDEFSTLTGIRGTIHHPSELERLIHPEDIGQVMTLANQLLNGVRYQEIDFRIIRPGGDIRYLRGRAKTFRDDRSLVRVVGTIQDISQHKWAEEALLASERKYRDVVEWAPLGFYQSTRDGQIIAANRTLASMLGYNNAAEMIGLDIRAVVYFDPTDRDRLINKHDTSDQRYVNNEELRWKKKDGTPLWILLSVHSTKHGGGTNDIYEGFVTDITEKKKSEEVRQALEHQLAQAQKLESLGTLAGGIAHDFNNILGIILGYSNYLRKHLGEPDKAREGFASIEEAVSRGTGVVRQLLTFARRAESKPELLSLNDEIRSFEKLMRATIPKTIQLILQLEPETPVIKADRNQLHQVLMNLALNARDAMNGKGKIRITTGNAEGGRLRQKYHSASFPLYAHIRIEDSGPGMSADVLERIYEPFFTTKEKGKGTGLGLPVTFGIVKSHNGLIDVDSAVGKGTTFHIFLPAEAESKTKPSDQIKHDITGGRETILIIEDENRLRKLLGMILSDLGYTVLSAANGNEGVALFEHHEHEVSLVITDLDMPVQNGLDVATSILAIRKDIAILISSGYIEPSIRRKCADMGITSIIQKPFDAEAIAEVVRKTIDSSKPS